jgi:uncharacterized protein
MTFRVILATLVFAAGLGAARAVADDFTIPPTPGHFVTDTAGVLSSATRASLENELQSYERATGHQVIVWIGETTGDVPLETWTGDTAHKWRVGRKGHDDGAILFLFMQDHRIRIEVGYGLESSLTDAAASRIIADQIRPRMRSGNVDGAVSSGVAAMLTTITPAYDAVSPPPDETEAPSAMTGGGLVVLLILALFALMAAVAIILRIVYAARYGYLTMREGSKKAKADMKNSAFWTGTGAGFLASSGSGDGGDFDGGGFSAGGGDFGGGGASGGW